jgi:hypothetical protein
MMWALWNLDLWSLGDELTSIIFDENETSNPEWSSKWKSMAVKNISVYWEGLVSNDDRHMLVIKCYTD